MLGLERSGERELLIELLKLIVEATELDEVGGLRRDDNRSREITDK